MNPTTVTSQHHLSDAGFNDEFNACKIEGHELAEIIQFEDDVHTTLCFDRERSLFVLSDDSQPRKITLAESVRLVQEMDFDSHSNNRLVQEWHSHIAVALEAGSEPAANERKGGAK